ncbi:hypothetical protein TanjilG_11312 [Lupinus angustifolius]|uniref:CRAL-TRIO domain-containing protein n=1 Tax=Lupinus angustifolius TaxID=3871 RepID=A0A1J7H8Q9_LUPAN|nr:PREDICTED: phosphatidylinositol/phosphatidylcholine transfer protein SFH1-like [Lupinus angustifolius]XP_019447940.1 PREDICTED: phosphatidylinositol/phosphatidylcholine transfer protein SFH1-like [Lupinus angustifolius]OIW09174.1 hypothetical protein TanjilG_11312 [Lupinus angustifolius]
MGNTVDCSKLSNSSKPGSFMTENKAYKKLLIPSQPKCFTLINYGGFGSSSVGSITIFLLKVAALEMFRRFSKSRCPYVWRVLQALQMLCYPPLEWIPWWEPFKGLVKSMQVLSRPLLVISIATSFSDKSECSNGTLDCSTDSHDSVAYSEQSKVENDMNTSQCSTDPKVLESENWLMKLRQELENQGISLPERINDDELHRFCAASNNDFSCFLASIKKTINWRNTYGILSEEELIMWSEMIFWHGSDVMHRPCLVVRLGLACNTLTSQDRPGFAQAVISQVEYGVLQLVDADNPQITVLVDCEGLSPLRIPMQMMKYCSSLLQDHFPNCLGCLFVIRLPEVVDAIAQTFIEVLEPATRNKLKIEGHMYQKVLSDYLLTLPSYLGGSCTCMKCSEFGNWEMLQPHAIGTSRRYDESDVSDDEDSSSLHLSNELRFSLYGSFEQVIRNVITGFLIFWAFIALCALVHDSGGLYSPS